MKKQLKKSLSLFLAVLMLLSCWVWVAPEKAKAGTATPYYVKIVSNVTDTGNENSSQLIINYKDTNGKGDSGRKVVDFGQMSWDGNSTIFSGPIDGWPVSFTWTWNIDDGRAEEHQNITFYVGGTEDTCTTQLWKDNYNFTNPIIGTSYLNLSATLSTSYNPKFTEITEMKTTDVAVNKMPNGAAVTTNVEVTAGKDQYGVGWVAALPTDFTYSLSYTDDSGNEKTLDSSKASIAAVSGKPEAKVTIQDDIQTLFPEANSGKIYAKATYGSKSKSVAINMGFPNYQATFKGNGGLIGAVSGEARDEVVITKNNKLYYKSVIGRAPEFATRDGFVLMGYYSDDNADAAGFITENNKFTGTKFIDDETTVPTQGDTVWYAAWQAAPLNVTFVTADNQFIATIEGRHNNYLTATNMYNGLSELNKNIKEAYKGNGSVKFNSKYEPIYTDGATNYNFAGWKIIESTDESLIGKVEDGNNHAVITNDVTFQAIYKKADAETYTVSFYDGDGKVFKYTDKDGNEVTASKGGYNYRDDVTMPETVPTKVQDEVYSYEFIGWANRLVNDKGEQTGPDFHAVDENDKDAQGARIVYTHKDAAEFTVTGNASYVPVFRMIPREYSVTYNYTVNGGATESVTIKGYHYGDNPVMPAISDNYTENGLRYYIDGWKVGTAQNKLQLNAIVIEGNTDLTAGYGAPKTAEYVVNFYGKDVDGEKDILLNEGNNTYKHNLTVAVPDVPQNIDTAEALYTFAGWSPAVPEKYKATADAEYRATYTKHEYADVHFYNYDGTLLYKLDGKENSFFAKETTIPAYENLVDGENVLPSREEDVKATYEFIGWKDSQGNIVKPGEDIFQGDVYLTAQYKEVLKDYTVKFLNDDGTVISENVYNYGAPIVVPAETPVKASDNTYDYTFRAWSPEVSEVCYGDATYTATYRRAYRYYTVTWLDDTKAFYSKNSYTFGSKIQQAVIDEPKNENTGAPNDGYAWAVDYWVQCDENGQVIYDDEYNLVKFQIGMKMPAENIYFYPVFKEVAYKYSVTFNKIENNGDIKAVGTVKIAYGENINEYSGDFASDFYKVHDNNYHYVVDYWVTTDTETVVDYIAEDVSVKPVYKAVEHTEGEVEYVVNPTCTTPGFVNIHCGEPSCEYVKTNVAQDIVADESEPMGQIYVGSDLWTWAQFNSADIDYNDVKYINSKTTLIVNAEDTGMLSMPWNLDGKLNRGVGKIEYYVSEKAINPEYVVAGAWTEIYNRDLEKAEILKSVLSSKGMTEEAYNKLNESVVGNNQKKEIDAEVAAIQAGYKANVTGVTSNLKVEGKDEGLKNGGTYIIYIKVSDVDPDGNADKYVSNVGYFSSGTLQYGTKAPEITVSGEGYGAKFCAEATISVTDDNDGVVVYIDNTEVTLENGKYVATAAGVHTVTAVDINGNKTTKIYEITGNHSYRNYTTLATCDDNGERFDLCTVCGAKANETVIYATGHSFRENYTEIAATCDRNGSRTYVCENNCGTTLLLAFDKETGELDPDKLAQAEKYDSATDTWVALEEADLDHLKATGVHTYAKVKDEDGNDTAEDAWVIDKAATCSVAGSKHRDCLECGVNGREIAEIPVDTENGHKFYRAKVTTEPTCTEKGEKTKTCRYCKKSEHVEYVDALGHIAGEYKVITEAQCEDEGSKILVCGRCPVELGEPIEGQSGKFDGKTVEIPALGHAYVVSGIMYKADDGKYYQDYVCANNNTHTKKVEVEAPPAEATVKFNFNGGYYVIPAVGSENQFGYEPEMMKGTQSIKTNVGATISSTQIEKAIKAATATYTYTFSHWATKNEDGTYTEVKFPIEVKGDATYYAVYAEKYVNYTITYYYEDGVTEYSKLGYRHNGENVKLANGPAKASDWQNDYVFAGWKVKGSNPEVVYTKDATIEGANIKLVATYTSTSKTYGVTYAYSSNNTIESFRVNAGAAAEYHGDTPAKAYDGKYHYTFTGWNKAIQLAAVKNDIYTTPNFEATKHNCVKDLSLEVAPTCTEAGISTYVCECGYSYPKVSSPALGHEYGTPVTVNGVTTRKCTRCNETTEEGIKFNVTFYNADKESVYMTSANVVYGTLVSTILPTPPVKPSTNTYDYAFSYWATKSVGEDGKAVYTRIADDLKVTEALELYPVYADGTLRTYKVTFISEGEIIHSVTVEAGASATCAEPKKDYDNDYHYTFKGWNYAEELKAVYRDITATAEFTQTAHSCTADVDTAATCKANRIDKYTCACSYSYTAEVDGSKLAHVMEEVGTENGVTTYKCQNCDETSTEIANYTITYYVDGKAYTSTTAAYGDKLIEKLTEEIPSKATDDSYTYEFSHWYLKDDAEEKAIADDVTVTGNMEVVAKFNATARKYTVVFAYNASNVLATVENVDYADITTTQYNGKTPVKKNDSTYHYVFSGFKFAKTDATGSVHFYYAQFDAVEHTLTEASRIDATCQDPAKVTYNCNACSYTRETTEGKEKPHVFVKVKETPATPENSGKIEYKCENCPATKSEEIKWQNPETENVTIKITVKDSNNNLVEGAKVDIYSGSNYVATGYTGINGVVEFKVEKGEYRAIISIKNASSVEFTFKADKDGEVNNVPSLSIRTCGCACHHTGLWGKIFRFFHKIIKSLTGEFKCCSDPSELYN